MPQPLTDEALAAMAAGVEIESETTTSALANTENVAALLATNAELQLQLSELQTTLKAQNEQMAQIAHEASDAKAAQDAKDTQYFLKLSSFVEIARNSVKTMGIHFGVKADAVAAMDADQVLTEHARLADLFKAKFRVGGVAATTPEVVTKAKVSVPPIFAALLKSTAK